MSTAVSFPRRLNAVSRPPSPRIEVLYVRLPATAGPDPLSDARHPAGATAPRRLAGHYILTLDRGTAVDPFSSFAKRAADRGWPVDTLIADHTPERSAVPALVRLLLRSRP